MIIDNLLHVLGKTHKFYISPYFCPNNPDEHQYHITQAGKLIRLSRLCETMACSDFCIWPVFYYKIPTYRNKTIFLILRFDAERKASLKMHVYNYTSIIRNLAGRFNCMPELLLIVFLDNRPYNSQADIALSSNTFIYLVY